MNSDEMDKTQIEKNTDNENPDNETEVKTGKKGKAKVIAVITLVILVVIAAGSYFWYMQRDVRKANLYLSTRPITSSEEAVTENEYISGQNIYLFFNLKKNNLNADECIVEIQYKKDANFAYYKKITYEIDHDFSQIQTLIPGEYFSRQGQYTINVYLDGTVRASRTFSISSPRE